MATKTLLTIEEFLRLPQPPDASYELVEGELVTVSPGMLPHNIVRDDTLVIVKAFLAGRKLGTVVAEQSFHLFGNTVRVPDLAFIRSGRELATDRPIEGAPDLVIEVVSPTNTPREISQRISDYFAAGCKRAWILYPEHREVYIHGLGGVVRRHGDELLEDSELLPGFSVKVSSLFEGLGAWA
ncbi:MAG: Uma2 family endonuclease [Terriglobia bacterium]